MSIQQKSALYQLIVGLIAVIAYVLLRILVSLAVAPAAMALLALTGATPFLFRREASDERERYLARRAALFGFGASYLVVIAMCMGLWFLHAGQGEATINVDVLPLVAMGTFASLVIVRAAALLLLASRPMDVAE